MTFVLPLCLPLLEESPLFLAFVWVAAGLWLVFLLTTFLNWLSYRYLKNRIMSERKWGLNICCGKTDGGGIYADIVRHGDIRNFVLIEDIYNLPFEDGRFDSVICSHTIEHVDDPRRFDEELRRVGKSVTYLRPPLWDVSAALNVLEHKWIFLTLSTRHLRLPAHVRLPLARTVQRVLGQRVKG